MRFLSSAAHLLPRAAAAALLALLVFPAPAKGRPMTREGLRHGSSPFQEPAPTADRGRLAKRILHLVNGQLLRGSTRRRDGLWEWRGSGRWQTLPPGQVVRVVEEKALLREVRQRREAAAVEDGSRIGLWSWMADEGLYAETLEEIDSILERDPHHQEACTFLRERNLYVSLPEFCMDPAERDASGGGKADEDRERFLRYAAGSRAAIRELCLAHISLSSQGAEALFAAELRSPSSKRRELAAVALGRLAPGEQGRALLVHAVFDATEDVRRACARSLGAAGDPALTLPLTRALGSDSAQVSHRAAEALGAAGYVEAAGPLIYHLASLAGKSARGAGGASRPPASHIFVGTQRAYVQDFDVEVANGAAVADPQINVITSGSVLDVRVLGLRTVSFRTRRTTVCRALRRLTGQDLGDRPDDWLAWWRDRGAEAPPTAQDERTR